MAEIDPGEAAESNKPGGDESQKQEDDGDDGVASLPEANKSEFMS